VIATPRPAQAGENDEGAGVSGPFAPGLA